MKNLLISLPETSHRELKNLSQILDQSVSQTIRDAISEKILQVEPFQEDLAKLRQKTIPKKE